MFPAFAKLAQNGNGAAARLSAKHKALMCSKSFPMMRRLFDAVVRPTVSYGSEVWATACPLARGLDLKDMLGVQMAFFCQLCHFRKSVTPGIIFREFSERPWLDTWWSCLLGFMRRLSVLPDDSLHLDILRDNIADAKGPLPSANGARGIEVKFAALGMASPYISSGIGVLDSHMASWTGWLGPGNGPGMACMCPLGQLPLRGPSCAHIIIGLAAPARSIVSLIMSATRLWALVHFRLGSHSLPAKQICQTQPPAPFPSAALKLLAMSFITFSAALPLLPSGRKEVHSSLAAN